MARSMTAYGRAHIKTSVGFFSVEIHSVNRKSLDIHSNIPRELLSLDMGLRKRLGEDVKRGNITIRITKDGGGGALSTIPSPEVMKEVHKQWTSCAESLGYGKEIPFSSLMEFVMTAPSIVPKVDESFKKELMKGFDEACSAFIAMKEKEGKALKEDILPRLDHIAGKVEEVSALTQEAPKRYLERITKKLEELKINHEGDEDRLARELVLFADRIDVTEEIIRLLSHVKQFRDLLGGEKTRVGRELDFLTQEMNRELNTIGAKSQELEMTQAILAAKSELDKIREQLQNIE